MFSSLVFCGDGRQGPNVTKVDSVFQINRYAIQLIPSHPLAYFLLTIPGSLQPKIEIEILFWGVVQDW
jgi:hypothetical protein